MTFALEELPQLYIDTDYIPADLLFPRGKYPRFIYISRKKWEINLEDGCYPFYERYVPRQLKEEK